MLPYSCLQKLVTGLLPLAEQQAIRSHPLYAYGAPGLALLTTSCCQHAAPAKAAGSVASKKFVKPGAGQVGSKKKEGAEIPGGPKVAAAIEMLLHHRPELRQPVQITQTVDPELRARTAAYEELKTQRHEAWKAAAKERYFLQKAALHALPRDLRELAVQPDLTPSPPGRGCLFDTPPAAYLSQEASVTQTDDIHSKVTGRQHGSRSAGQVGKQQGSKQAGSSDDQG